jgi:16S rRNA processing protein RimM
LSKTDFLKIGKITKHQGIRGYAKLYYYGDIENFNYREVFLENEGKLLSYFIEHWKIHKNFIIIKLDGIDSIDHVNHLLKGKDVFIKKEQLPPLEEGEYYWYQLLNLSVYTLSGEYLGEITDIMETGSNDVFQVTGGDKELLIPYIEQVVKEIDLKSGKMVVQMLEEV